MTARKTKVAFIGDASSVFISRTHDALEARGYDIQVFDTLAPTDFRPSPLIALTSRVRRLRRLYAWLKHTPELDAVVIHAVTMDVSWMVPVLKRFAPRIALIAYGSDVLRRNKKRDWLLKLGLHRIDIVAATNDHVLKTLQTSFPTLQNKPGEVVRFGLPVFDALDKLNIQSAADARRHLGLDPTKECVCLGYSASAGQRQSELITTLSKHTPALEHLQFIVPVQYGDKAVQSDIQAVCEAENTRHGADIFKPITEFYDVERSAIMRRAISVLINHSVSDAFSGTVQEVIYAGNLVLAAQHLPYETMPGFGTAIKPYEDLDEMVKLLAPKSLQDWKSQAAPAHADVKQGLASVSSWETAVQGWRQLIGK